MKYLFEEDFNTLFKTAKRLFLFLDYDGTLTDFIESPALAFLDKYTRSLLRRLSKNRRFILGIISGRGLHDLQRKVGLKGVLYSGSHGLEFYARGKDHRRESQITKRYLIALEDIKKTLGEQLKGIDHVVLEDKEILFAIHYRLASVQNIIRLKKICQRVVSPYVRAKIVRIGTGRRMLEVRPRRQFSKFDAVHFFEKIYKKKKDDLTIYIGDDVTDEDIFRRMHKRDISVRVEKTQKSKARYFVHNQFEVQQFLSALSVLRPFSSS
ncbi:MAG: trehalose-phosphatase [Candidatus Omnitrophica bacterium]|nr:trehalose-phosphatase [Candidatus Omnitrophota bacterium]